MTDADARAQEIAERIADATFGSNTIGARQNPNWRMLVDRIAAALRERPAGYRHGAEDAASVATRYRDFADDLSSRGAADAIATAIRALAQKEPAKLETTEEERAQYRSYGVGFPSQDSFATMMVRDFDRLLAAHKGEREDGQHAVLGPYAVIDRGCISIRVPIDVLPNAFKCIPARYGLNDANGDPLYDVRDPAVFAKSVADRLNNESEDGTTAIHRMLDAAMAKAVEQGDEGVEEVATPAKED